MRTRSLPAALLLLLLTAPAHADGEVRPERVESRTETGPRVRERRERTPARNTIERTRELGQSIWQDDLSRADLRSGKIDARIRDGVSGITTNPSIFEKAIATSDAYSKAIERGAKAGKSTNEIYESLVVNDVRRAADKLAKVHQASGGGDGFVSLEVNPHLAHDTAGTVAEARRLRAAVGRDNLMIKIPATAEGIQAIEQLTGEGVSVNATLIFSRAAYRQVIKAYVRGLEKLDRSGGDVSKVASVASFFVSRVDAALAPELGQRPKVKDLDGQVAIANIKLAWQDLQAVAGSERFAKLEAKGARLQRLLLASTGTKSAALPDTLYVDSLIGTDTVNTVPNATLDAFLDHGMPRPSIGKDVDQARRVLRRVARAGIKLDRVTDTLLTQGLDSFTQAFDRLQGAIGQRAAELRAKPAR